MRTVSNSTIKEIEQFKTLRYAKTSSSLMNYIRKNNPYVKIFRPGSFVKAGKGSVKYSCRDIFGQSRFSHIYDIRYTEKFVNFLVSEFLKNNPDPDINIRKAFTRILHNNGLHWECCAHVTKKEELLMGDLVDREQE